ncbi:DUF4097 family beta strand repeat-containing protein [Spongiimicrobium salis]|uniref:hypothetical protein n=1 Tax=Spongiimicrobium salis TaxID=1667022 RepID=UPI00374D82DE
MKQIIISLAVVLCVSVLKAQDYSKSLSGIEWVKIESKATVVLKTHNSNELLIKGKNTYGTPDRAKGLKLVGAGGSDNTDVGFYVVEEGNTLIVKNLRKNKSAEIYLPENQNVSITSSWNGHISVNGFKGEVEASAQLNGGITMKDVSGPITANSLNGAVEIQFVKVNQKSPITIATTNGVLDVTLPGNTPADLSMGTVNGEIYTNFDLKTKTNKEGYKAISTKNVKGSINNGGVKIKLKSVNGTIYLRKE